MRYRNDITADYVRQLLDYVPSTGDLIWKSRTPDMFSAGKRWSSEASCNRWNARFAGKLAGSVMKVGYVNIKISGHLYKAHRLAWLIEKGEWPSADIDHENADKGGNAFANIRDADKSQNAFNKPPFRNNKSGLKGVHQRKSNGRWVAEITVRKQRYSLGDFDTPEQAHAAYCEAAAKYHGEFARVK